MSWNVKLENAFSRISITGIEHKAGEAVGNPEYVRRLGLNPETSDVRHMPGDQIFVSIECFYLFALYSKHGAAWRDFYLVDL